MRSLIASLAIVAACFVGGCQSDDNKSTTHSHTKTEMKTTSADACSHCAGVQTATADGKCPKCGMKM